LTAFSAPGLPTSAALPAQSLTMQAVLVSARPSVAICSFHKLEQRRSFFIAAPVVWNSLTLRIRFPSISRSQFRTGLMTHLFYAGLSLNFPLRTIEEIKQNWTELREKAHPCFSLFSLPLKALTLIGASIPFPDPNYSSVLPPCVRSQLDTRTIFESFVSSSLICILVNPLLDHMSIPPFFQYELFPYSGALYIWQCLYFNWYYSYLITGLWL